MRGWDGQVALCYDLIRETRLFFCTVVVVVLEIF